METLAYDPLVISNWEPLHPKQADIVPVELKWGTRPYLREHIKDPIASQLMQDILTLKKNSPWTLRYSKSLSKLCRGKKVMTKFVRASLLLPWLCNTFEFRYRPLYLLRHPLPTVLSQASNFYSQNENSNTFQLPDSINNDIYGVHFSYLQSLESTIEQLLALWCIHNKTVIEQSDNERRWRLVFYENLVTNPEAEFSEICQQLGLEIELNTVDFKRASSTDFQGAFQQDSDNQLSKWRSHLSDETLFKLQSILDYFGVHIYSVNSDYPVF